jgi:hypothetical protein
VIVDWTGEFDRWLTHAEEQGGRLLAVAVALLKELNDLPAKPVEETAASNESGRHAGMSCSGSPIHSIPPSLSGSSAGSPVMLRS